ncbi:MAG: outer membrane beta-barrel protein [Pseudomonadota bacterium]
MSRFVTAGLIAAIATGLAVSSAQAADLDPPIFEKPRKVATGGFYLRGDIGASIWKDPSLAFQNDVAGFTTQFDDENADPALVIGGGIGYKFKKYFRADLTFDIRTNKQVDATVPCGACLAAGTIPDDIILPQEVNKDLYTFFANAYFDLRSHGRFKPYVGGGAGFAFVDYDNYVSRDNPTAANTPGASAGDLAAVNPSGEANQIFGGNSDVRFAWNVTAGASLDLTHNLLLDANYRYIRIQDGPVAFTAVGPVIDDGLQGHEFRLGLRYTFGKNHQPVSHAVFK